MNKIHNIFAMAALALTFTACSSDNDNPANNDGKEYPISLSVGIGDLSVVTRAETSTGSSTGTTTLASGDLGLFITKNGDKSGTGKYLCDNAKFTYSSGTTTNGWSCSTKYYWASDNATIDYIAYYPYKDDSNVIDTNSKTITWNVSSQSATATGYQFPALDLLWESKSEFANPADHKIPITLAHVCSKLTVNVSKLGSEIATGTTISGIKINSIDVEGNFDLNAGTWSYNDDAQNASIAMFDVTPSTFNNGDPIKTFEAILIPQTLPSASLSITLSTDAVYQLSLPTTQKFEKGKHYTITIQVGQDEVKLGNITQNDWVSVDGGPLTAQ